MRNTILALAFLPSITFGHNFSESSLKDLEDAYSVKFSGGLSSAFSNDHDQGLNWFKNKAFELDNDFTIRMCGDGLCYIRENTGSLMLAMEQEKSDFNGRKLQGQLVRIIGTDIYGTIVLERLSTHKKTVKQLVKLPVPSPTKSEYNLAGTIDELIKVRSAEGWARPPSVRKEMVVELEISMTPDGTVKSVSVTKTSGDEPFDTSVVAAVKNIGRLTEIQEIKPLDIDRYRSFKMKLTPEDLTL